MCYTVCESNVRHLMKINPINVQEVLTEAKAALEKEAGLSDSFKAIIKLLIIIIQSLLPRLTKNSKNSSIPPSQDPNRAKNKDKDDVSGKKKPGGQPGREKKILEPVSDPDEIVEIPVDRAALPKNRNYTTVGYLKRQVFDIILKQHVKEYRLEIVEDEQGKRYTADSPSEASRPTQYGASVKALSVYMSLYQMIPYARTQDFFMHQAGMSFSEGSVFNFNKEAFERLEGFEKIAKSHLKNAEVMHNDETGININSKRAWLHNASNNKWVLLAPNKARGCKAMNEIGILPEFKGVTVHDNWSPYFTYKDCTHALCNAHHLRELQAVIEAEPNHTWAQQMKDLLCEINEATTKAGGALAKQNSEDYRIKYREIIKIGEKESPLPPTPSPDPTQKKKRGKVAKTKERNLLERLRDLEDETLRFMVDAQVPFTNNQGENDIRMTKVQQKISGCFKSMEGAQIFCRVRSYLLTAQKHGIHATDALNALFQGKLPAFCE